MISKTAMTERVKRLAWKDVGRGLDEDPRLLDHRDERGRNWLHLCCSVDVSAHRELAPADSLRLAAALIDRGIDIDAPAFTEGEWKATPLWYSIARGRNLALAKYLLKRGCDPNHCLWAAVFHDDRKAIRLLIDCGAQVDPRHEEGTPFVAAIGWSRFDAAKLLLELGADVDAVDTKGRTALHQMLAKNSDKKHLRMIVAHGARGDIEDRNGQTATEILRRKRDPELRELAERLRRAGRPARRDLVR